METFYADLHCHTTCSDGTSTPKEIVKKAADIGLRGLSITDHDTIAAYAEALPIANKLSISLLPGVEFSSVEKEETVHILAYGFSLDDPSILAFCQKHRDRRRERNQAILQLLSKHNMPIDYTEMLQSIPEAIGQTMRTIGRPHIAMAMVQKGYTSSVAEAFHRFLGDNSSCFVPGEHFSVDETLSVIHQAHAFAILAHPHLLQRSGFARQLLEKPFDGIEGYYARMPAEREKPWIDLGRKAGLLVTGGSDFHGTIKPHIPLGASWVDEKTFHILYEQYIGNSKT